MYVGKYAIHGSYGVWYIYQRNLQRTDPRVTDPEKTWESNSSIATSEGKVRWEGPIQFLMEYLPEISP